MMSNINEDNELPGEKHSLKEKKRRPAHLFSGDFNERYRVNDL